MNIFSVPTLYDFRRPQSAYLVVISKLMKQRYRTKSKSTIARSIRISFFFRLAVYGLLLRLVLALDAGGEEVVELAEVGAPCKELAVPL